MEKKSSLKKAPEDDRTLENLRCFSSAYLSRKPMASTLKTVKGLSCESVEIRLDLGRKTTVSLIGKYSPTTTFWFGFLPIGCSRRPLCVVVIGFHKASLEKSGARFFRLDPFFLPQQSQKTPVRAMRSQPEQLKMVGASRKRQSSLKKMTTDWKSQSTARRRERYKEQMRKEKAEQSFIDPSQNLQGGSFFKNLHV